MELSLYQVDAFTKRLFSGNPAAVCPLEEWLPDAVMQHIAAENNLSETAFFVREGDDFRLRWFTPTAEVRLCGHATLASAHVLFQHLGFTGTRLTFHSLSGPLTVGRLGEWYQMNFPADPPTPIAVTAAFGNAIGIPPSQCFRGRDDLLAVLENAEELEQLQPDFQQIAALGGRGLIVTAPGKTTDFISRCFYPNYGVPEDPVTGSAHTTLTPYWSKRLQRPKLSAFQASTRGGHLQCTLLGDRVELAGQAVTYLEGQIRI